MKKIKILSTKFIKKELLNSFNIDFIEFFIKDFVSIKFCNNNLLLKFIKKNINDESYAFIFTSKNSINSFLGFLNMNGLNLKYKNCFSISPVTTEIARKNGFNILGEGIDSNELSKVILNSKYKNFIYPSSKHRLQFLEKNLSHLDLNVFETYIKYSTSVKIEFAYDGIIFLNPLSVDFFLKKNILSEDKMIFCIGKTTKHYIESLGFKNKIITSDANTLENLLIKIYNFYKNGK